MKASKLVGAAVAAALAPAAGPAAANDGAEVETVSREQTVESSLALGVSVGWQQRADFGADSRSAFAPELVGQTYAARYGRFHLRPGVRLGFIGLDQAEMPRSVQIREYDLIVRGELGAVYDGPVIPSVVVGAGAVSRWVRLDTEQPLTVESEDISRFELLPELYGRIGLGLPVARGRLVIEPFLGRAIIFGDDRAGWTFGADATFAL